MKKIYNTIIVALISISLAAYMYNSRIKKNLNNEISGLRKDLALAISEKNKCDSALTVQNKAIASIALDLEKSKIEAAKENIVIVDRFIEREKIIKDNEELDAIETIISEWLK